jgi:integrase
MRAKSPPRILGPYQDRDKWRLIIVENGQKENQIYTTKEEALRMQRKLAKAIAPQARTVDSAIDAWTAERRKTGACKEATLEQQATRVRFLLCNHLEEDLMRITTKKAELLYEKHRTRPTKRGTPLAVATHTFDLKCVKNFFKWCVSRRYLIASPFVEIRPVGRKRAGKPQLRIEEAKRFTDAGLQHFEKTKNPLAIAALVAITMGPRASEVLNRSVRDLDNGGKILVIDSGKNERAKRRLDVPLFLQPILLGLAQGCDPLAKLFGLNHEGRPWGRQSLYSTVQRICKEAKVPLVCTHSLRGFWATTSVQIGIPSQAVAATLGHGSFAITERHYAAPGSRQNAGTQLVVEALRGEGPTKPSVADILAGLDARQIGELMALLTQNRPLNPSASVSQPVLGKSSATGDYGDDHTRGTDGPRFP